MPRTSSGRAVALLVVLGVVLAAAPTLAAGFTLCGVSGCTGGGFGVSTDPGTTRALLVVAGVVAALPLATYAWLRRSGKLAACAGALAVVVMLLAGALIGSDVRGCPSSVDDATCRGNAR
ncbi:hypothetical protein [Nocardioides zeicaulis]|uniref:Uncharacterized protein n=1 Tax=Nocardioides zeicaulis TaxID=1776857 RepID=A0ABV6E6A4_9ACTN